MKKWKCTVCGYIYDEAQEDMPFASLPEDWTCPRCGAPLSAFQSETGEEKRNEADITVADKIVEQLVAYGVKRIYGIPGNSNLPLTDAIRRHPDIDLVLTRHEQAAAYMASAHAKLTGRIGVCMSIAGPGATNLITGVMGIRVTESDELDEAISQALISPLPALVEVLVDPDLFAAAVREI